MTSGMKEGNHYQPAKTKMSYQEYNKQPYAKKHDIDKMDNIFLRKHKQVELTQEKKENLD